MVKLNLGCGKRILEGWINVDYFEGEGVNIIHDLNSIPYPWKNNSIDEINCRMVLEHLDIPVYDFLKEIHRILGKEGQITITVPHFTSWGAYYEHHKKFFRYNSMQIKTSSFEDGIYDKFDEIERDLKFERKWFAPLNPVIEKIANKKPSLYEGTFLKALFPAYELKVVLVKK